MIPDHVRDEVREILSAEARLVLNENLSGTNESAAANGAPKEMSDDFTILTSTSTA